MFANLKTKIAAFSDDRKSILALVGGTTIAQGLNFLFAPIQTRLFKPEVFGELSVFISITGIISIIVCLRYELAIVLPEEKDEGFSLLKLAITFAALVSIPSLFVFGVFRTPIFEFFNAPGLAKYWYFVPLTLFLTGVVQASNYWLTRERKFTILSYNKILPVLAVNFVSIGLGFAGERALIARLFSILVSNLVNISLLAWVIIPEFRIDRKSEYQNRDLLKKYKNFIVYDIWGALINNLSWMIVPILMNTFYGSFVAGQYSIGMRVIQLPASVIGASIGQVFYKSANERKNSKTLYKYTLSIIKKLFVFTSPFAIILLIFGKVIFTKVFGQEWELAGKYVQILAPWAIVWFISSPISSIYPVFMKQNISLITSSLNLITRFGALYIGSVYKMEILGLILFSFSGIIVNCLSLFLCIKITKDNDKEI